MDITSPRTAFRTQTQPTYQDVVKLAAAQVRAELEQEHAYARQKTSRAEGARYLTLGIIDSIVKTSQVAALVEAGVLNASEQELAEINAAWQKASEDAEALADAIAEGDATEQEFVEALVEAAAQDPELASQLITAAEGEEYSPEDVGGAADDLADLSEAEEAGTEEAAKVSSGARARLEKFSSRVQSDITGEIITRMADNIRYLRSQG